MQKSELVFGILLSRLPNVAEEQWDQKMAYCQSKQNTKESLKLNETTMSINH